MTFCELRSALTIQGNVKLVLWDNNGRIIRDDTVIETSDIGIFNTDCYDNFNVKYIFVNDKGFLQIDMETE